MADGHPGAFIIAACQQGRREQWVGSVHERLNQQLLARVALPAASAK